MDDSTGLPYDQELAAEWQRRLDVNMMGAVASVVLIVAEFFHMLDLEVPLIWQSTWSLVKALYIANRILPFLVLPFPIILFTFPNPEPLACKAIFGMCVFGVASCVLLAEALLYVRIYALSGRNRWMRIFLILNFSVVCSVAYMSLILFIYTGSWGRLNYAPRPYTCSIISTHMIYIVVGYSILLYNALVTLVLSIWLGLAEYRSFQGSPLLKVFYRDGLFYFIVIAIMAVGNGVTAARLPVSLNSTLASTARWEGYQYVSATQVGYQFLLGPSVILLISLIWHVSNECLVSSSQAPGSGSQHPCHSNGPSSQATSDA